MTLRAGFAKRDITPEVGCELAGFGPFLERRSTHVVAPLYARALAVDDGRGRWVLVSCDLLGVTEATVAVARDHVSRRTGYTPSQIAVHATHNHSGPGTIPDFIGWGTPDPAYLERLGDQLGEVCVEAIADLQPAEALHGEAPLEGFAYNRMRWRPPPGDAIPALAGAPSEAIEETDRRVRVLRFDRAGSPAGFVASYSCHPVVCGESATAIHGDFPGMALATVEEDHPGVTGLFLQGAAGDVDPVYAHGPPRESERALVRLSRVFADRIGAGLSTAEPIAATPVGSLEREVPHTLSRPSVVGLQRRLGRYRSRIEDGVTGSGEERLARVYAISLSRTIAELEQGRLAQRPVTVHALKLGTITLVCCNLEVFQAFQRRLRAVHGPDALVVSCTNGYLGYAPTRRAFSAEIDSYPAYQVPYLLGYLPFTEHFEEELAGGLSQAVADLNDE